MAHAVLVKEALVPFQEIVDVLDPVLTCMNPIDTRHWKLRHAHL
jgi:hypothetical protein